ncbi:hypothetical protein M3182_00665 [Mesobacillus maritimus]|uniref:hypothetical protein n=1 Tax=Mesobacillus maritimus TaxID=1643336 RepID=UPI00203F7F91|nr:hypothetical protein [Mesobacillus maritimus]MCM3584251.1 hypothetical protein [Mesobacillus maritimus]
MVQEDVKGIYSYYDYGFTRFNFEYSFSKNFSFLLELNDNLSDTKLFKEVVSEVDQLIKHYHLDVEMAETQSLVERWDFLYNHFLEAKGEYQQEFSNLSD